MMNSNKIYNSFNEFKQDYFPLDCAKKQNLKYSNNISDTGKEAARIILNNTRSKLTAKPSRDK